MSKNCKEKIKITVNAFKVSNAICEYCKQLYNLPQSACLSIVNCVWIKSELWRIFCAPMCPQTNFRAGIISKLSIKTICTLKYNYGSLQHIALTYCRIQFKFSIETFLLEMQYIAVCFYFGYQKQPWFGPENSCIFCMQKWYVKTQL